MTAEKREDRAVVDQAVHEQDRRARGLDVTDEQPTTNRREPAEGKPVNVGADPLLGNAERIADDVGRDPRDFDGGALEPGSAQHREPRQTSALRPPGQPKVVAS
jgi:hypothetical protein